MLICNLIRRSKFVFKITKIKNNHINNCIWNPKIISSHFQNSPKPIHNLFTVPNLLISVVFYGVDTPKTVNLVNNPPTLFTFAKNTPFCLSYANLRRLHRDPGHSTKISRKPRLQVHHSGSLRRPVQGRKPLVSLRNNAIPARPARGR